jgi:hypothetical protein
MELAKVEGWALAAGLSETRLRELRDDALLTAITAVLQRVLQERYGALSWMEQDRAGVKWLIVGADQTLRVPLHSASTAVRLAASGFPESRRGAVRPLTTAPDFLSALRDVWTEAIPFERLAADFEDSFANLVLNRVLFELRQKKSSVLEPTFEGHSYYPFPALRIGPSLEDVISCSNLSADPVHLPLIRLKAHRFVSVNWEENAEFLEIWSGSSLCWSPGLLPVHPWQASLSSVVKSALTLGLAEIAAVSVPAVPLASQRTCRVVATGYDIKMPIDATVTGERRLLYPANTLNAPVVSSLAQVLLRESGLPTLDFQSDVAAAAHLDRTIGCHLAVIFRSPLRNSRDETIVPALLLWSSNHLAMSLLRLTSKDAAYQVFEDYCRVLLAGPTEFYACHGLAFEPHLQNTFIRIRNGLPVGAVLRDLDGTILDPRRVPGHLQRLRLRLPIEPWSSMPAFQSGGKRLAHALTQGHLAQVMFWLVTRIDLDSTVLSQLLESVWRELIHSHNGSSRKYISELRAESTVVKSLLRNRLNRSMTLSFLALPD